MKFKINGTDLKRIMSIAGSAVAKDNTRPILAAINCKVENNTFVATGLNGYKMHQITVPCEVLEGDTAEEFNIKPLKEIQSGFIEYEIEVADGKITYSTFDMTLQVRLVEGTFLKVKEIYPKTPVVFSICVDPKMLKETLMAYGKDGYVRLDFYDKHQPFTVTTENKDKALVLPVRLRE